MVQLAFGEQTVSTGLSPRYQESWGAPEALREIIQEVLDVKARHRCRVKISWSRGRAVIEDDGPGFGREALALGISAKRGDGSQIGQFGEGMKLAFLVLSRLGRKVRAETVGFYVRPFIAPDPVLDCTPTLHFAVGPCFRTKGTRFEVECSRDELERARRMFLSLDPSPPRPVSPRCPEIMLPGGRVYVNGVLAAERADMAFSYAFSGEKAKRLQNRDRSAVDPEGLAQAVVRAWEKAGPRAVAELLRTLAEGERRFEHSLGIAPPVRAVRRAVRLIWPGELVVQDDGCVWASSFLSQVLRVRLVRLPYSWSWRWNSGIPFASREAERLREKARPLRRRDLSAEERKNLLLGRRLARRWIGPLPRMRVAERLELGGTEVLGTWNPGRQTITVSRKALASPEAAVGTIIHEALHAATGAPDASVAFEKAWEEVVVQILLKRREEKNGRQVHSASSPAGAALRGNDCSGDAAREAVSDRKQKRRRAAV